MSGMETAGRDGGRATIMRRVQQEPTSGLRPALPARAQKDSLGNSLPLRA
jgi:hypothetical protein